jgi:peptide/nickel transport system permease protein
MALSNLDAAAGMTPDDEVTQRPSPLARAGTLMTPLAQAVAVSFFVVLVTFFLIRAFLGDPARLKLGLNVSQHEVDALRAQWGLNRPLVMQFFSYLGGLFRGDLGTSIQGEDIKVSTLVFHSFGNTALLALVSMTFAVILGVAGGLWAALTKHRIIDAVLRGYSMLALSAPPALVGLLCILLIAVRAGWAPVGGWGVGYPGNLKYLWLPVVAVTILMTPVILRVVRERALAVVQEPHIEAARSRGMRPLRLVLRHLLPNCALPILTAIGLSLGALLSGAIVIEAVFGVPGLGQIMLNAMTARDFPVIQGAALVCGMVVALCNALAEMAQRAIDPRARA